MTRNHLATALIALLVLAGCGKSNKTTAASPTGTTSSAPTTIASQTPATTSQTANTVLSHRDLIAKSDAICQRILAKRASTPLETQTQIAANMPPLAVFEAAAVRELEALQPPTSIASEWHTAVGLAREIAEETAKYGTAARTGDKVSENLAFAKAGRTDRRLAPLFRRLGNKHCYDL